MAGEVIILDDEPHYARMLAELLQVEGFRTLVSTSPREVLEWLQKSHYDLVVADFKMPEMDGGEFLRRARVVRPGLPVIMISGMMNMPDLLAVANIGVTLVLEKPFDHATFVSYVSRFIPRHGEESGEAQMAAESGPPLLLSHFAGASASGLRAMRALRHSFEQAGHAFLGTPPGTEIELILRDVASWLGCGDRQHSFSLKELEQPSFHQALRRLETDGGGLVLLSGSGISPTEQLLRALRFLRQSGVAPPREGLRFLYHFVGLERGDRPPTKDDLPDPIAGRLVYVPPLRSRPLDLAVYVRRHLKQVDGPVPTLDPESVAALLFAPWPGNYEQLFEVLDSLRNTLRSRLVDVGTLRWIMEQLGVPLPSLSPRSALRAILVARQREEMQRLNDQGDELSPAALGIAPGQLDLELPWELQDLLCPELLEGDGPPR